MRNFDIPVDPDADQARQWAIDELAKRQYQDAKPGVGQQFLQAISDFFNWLLTQLSSALHVDPSIATVILVLVPVLVIGIIIFLVRPRLLRHQHQDAEIFEAESELSAAEHRRNAQQAAAGGDFALALTELFRAMVRSAEERVVIDPQPGRTADEVTVLLVAAFPSEQAALWETARGFNRVRYSPQLSGQLRIGSAEYQRALRLDQALLDLKAADDGVAQLEWVGPR